MGLGKGRIGRLRRSRFSSRYRPIVRSVTINERGHEQDFRAAGRLEDVLNHD
jgi:hypothetical protein